MNHADIKNVKWKFQRDNRIYGPSEMRKAFPAYSEELLAALNAYRKKYRFALTPYLLSLIARDVDGNPRQDDPIWRQFKFISEQETTGVANYDGITPNWERPEELPTPILHHKYPGRAIFRLTNSCFSYCNYCYMTPRVRDRSLNQVAATSDKHWQDSLVYLKNNPAVHDVLISGGDPLVLNNEKIDRILHYLRQIPSIETIRINTRALTHNPYRLDSDLVSIMKRHRVNVLEVHIVHPNEFTDEFDERISLLAEGGYRPQILWRAPLLKGINDTVDIMRNLLLGLYKRNITPYYLFHFAPFSPGRSVLGTPVRNGVKILLKLRRSIPGPAFPRYTLFHIDGKHDIPLEENGTKEFVYSKDREGKPIITFRNWKGDKVTYYDCHY